MFNVCSIYSTFDNYEIITHFLITVQPINNTVVQQGRTLNDVKRLPMQNAVVAVQETAMLNADQGTETIEEDTEAQELHRIGVPVSRMTATVVADDATHETLAAPVPEPLYAVPNKNRKPYLHTKVEPGSCSVIRPMDVIGAAESVV